MYKLYLQLKHWATREAPLDIKLPTIFPRVNLHPEILWFVEGSLTGLLFGFLIGLIIIRYLG